MHLDCAEWSHGVVKEEREVTVGEGDRATTKTKTVLANLERSVVNAMYQKCNHCRHFGASMKCKASGKFYHYPCGSASGSYMQVEPRLFVGHDSLTKVATLADPQRLYDYFQGEWQKGKVIELSPDKFDNLLFCIKCHRHFYYMGSESRITAVIRTGWQCQQCKWCQICREASHPDRFILCDVCDGAFHAHCLRPQMASIPKNGWKCKVWIDAIHDL